MESQTITNEPTPYSLNLKGAGEHFGFTAKTLQNWIAKGRLTRGREFINIGNKPLILRDGFINWLKEQDGSYDKGKHLNN